jgi:indoleamine 2,3-dioxygenase
MDEEWFILIHVDIEAKSAPAIAALVDAQSAAAALERDLLLAKLLLVDDTLGRIHKVLARMPEKCDPYIYYRRVRPYIHGWKDHPALPEGVVYEGVSEFAGRPQQFRGETGAQSSIIPSLDATLGIQHGDSLLSVYLREMRDYMPPAHRAFLDALERGPSLRNYIAGRTADRELRDAYNRCVEGVERFRELHLHYAATYIQQQHERGAANPTEVGTGGTPFMSYLEEHRRTTLRHLL